MKNNEDAQLCVSQIVKNGRLKGTGNFISDQDNNNCCVTVWQNTRFDIMPNILDCILLDTRSISQLGVYCWLYNV